MISEAWGRRRYKAVFISKIDEALGEATETQSWLEDARDCGYLEAAVFEKMDGDWRSIAAMLARMIDRANDFCKNAPNTDYRVSEESLLGRSVRQRFRSAWKVNSVSLLTSHAPPQGPSARPEFARRSFPS